MSDRLITVGKWWQLRQLASFVIGCIGLPGLIFGCVPSKVQTQAAPQFDPTAISSIAIFPFQTLQTPQWGYGQTSGGVRDPEEIRTQFRLPGSDQAQRVDSQTDLHSVSESATQRITKRVESVLNARPSLRIVGAQDVKTFLSPGDGSSMTSLRRLAKEVGEELNVDGVFMGLVRTYRERDGTRMGATPAAVGFEVFLVTPEDGTILWKGEFFEEQKPLTQDIVGFFEKSGGFVTAQELSELGVKKVMEAFPVGKVVPIAQ